MTAIKRAAVVGMGLMGNLHAQEYRQMAGVDLVGLVETDIAKHSMLREKYRVPVFATCDALLAEADLVSICTPDHLHVEAALAFLGGGARVLVEKPLAMTLGDGRRILATAHAPTQLAVGHVLRFDPRVIRCRELVQRGTVGEIEEVQVWRKTTRQTGRVASERTGVAWFLGIHDADLVRHVTGLDVVEVSATGRSVFSHHLDLVYAHVAYSNGAIGTMDNGWILPGGRANRALAGLRIVGAEGSIEIDLGHVDLLLSTGSTCVNVDTRNWPGDSEVGYSNIRGELRAFAGEQDPNAPTPATGMDGLIAMGVIDAIHRSIDSGNTVQRPALDGPVPAAGG